MNMINKIYLALLLSVMIRFLSVAQVNHFTIDASVVVGENTEFWKAAGSDHLFYHVPRPSGQVLLDRMQATQSHRYLRSHHTLSQDKKNGVLRGQEVYSEDANGNIVYNFSKVNEVYREYVKRGIKPIVEYDYMPDLLDIDSDKITVGNDEGMTLRNTGPSDWKKWSNLLKEATRNFIDEFGEEEVKTWYFEVWNEPDGWPVDQLDVFFKMYDVFVDALTSVNPNLKVGGPACYHEYFLRPFLEHVTSGTNHVTGKKGTRIDFISYHIYGLSGKWLNSEPHIQPQVQRFAQSVLWLKRLLKEFKSLKDVEFHINEWGMSSNYYRLVKDYPDLEYRNSEQSALFLVKLVNSLYQIEDNYNFPTDLLLYWGFSWEADEDEFFVGKRELTTAGDVPKPIQTGFEMLARLKEQRIKVIRSKKDNRYGLIATKSGRGDLSFIAYNYDETDDNLDDVDELEIDIKGLNKGANIKISETSLDRENNNTYRAWEKAGRQESSKGQNISNIRKEGDLSSTKGYEIKTNKEGNTKLKLSLQRHSMKLIELK
jgi:xylan 1,4-beta-xylosidase